MARLLVLTARLPYPPREGHQLRSWHILRALASRHEITLLSFVREEDEPDACAPLRELVAHLETFALRAQASRPALVRALVNGMLGPRPFVAEKYTSAAMRRRVAELVGSVDAVHVDILPLMALLPRRVVVPVVLNAHNVEHRLLQQRSEIEAGWPRRVFLRSQVDKLQRYERMAGARAAAILACSEADARQLSELVPQTPVAVVPNGVDVEQIRPRNNAPNAARIVFVGHMGWFPNRDGVLWFLDDVLPRILAVRPDAQFVIIGRAEGLRVPAKVRDAVVLCGFLDEIASVITSAAVCVVPLRTGSGTRLKVLEAMALAMPIVTTGKGAEGIALQPATEALFADDAPAFAAAVLRLMANRETADRLGRAARAKAEALYDWNRIGRRVLALYDDVLDARRGDSAARQRYIASPSSS